MISSDQTGLLWPAWDFAEFVERSQQSDSSSSSRQTWWHFCETTPARPSLPQSSQEERKIILHCRVENWTRLSIIGQSFSLLCNAKYSTHQIDPAFLDNLDQNLQFMYAKMKENVFMRSLAYLNTKTRSTWFCSIHTYLHSICLYNPWMIVMKLLSKWYSIQPVKIN